MARILIVGNWKMHFNASQASFYLHRLQERIKISRDVEVVLAPSMLVLQPLSLQIDRRKFRLAAQNAFYEDEGTYTGEVSVNMLRDLVHYVIVGHSERRHVLDETDDEIAKKVAACIRNDIMPILCIGETKHEREEGETKQVIHDQLSVALKNVTASDLSKVVIAYEPVWAISKGPSDTGPAHYAKPVQIEEAAGVINKNLAAMFGPKAASKVRLLYGGTVVPDIARGYLDIEGIDGFLVGGASLNYHQFSDIVDSAYRKARDSSGD
jgi:triosephosphate isomerase